MNFRTRTLETEQRFCQAITMETIEWVVPQAAVEAAIQEARVQEQRVRKLPGALTISGIGMALFV